MDQNDSIDNAWKPLPTVSYLVDRQVHQGTLSAPPQGSAASVPARSTRQLKRTVATDGVSGPEIGRLQDAGRFMNLYCQRNRSRLWFASFESGTDRLTITKIWKRITKLQGEFGLRRHSVLFFEPGRTQTMGGHVLFLGNGAIVTRLRQSPSLQAEEAIKPVNDLEGLTLKYLAKKRSQKVGYGRKHNLGGRVSGPHRLEGGGDKVRLSKDLELDAIEAGYVRDWQHTNARRTETRKAYRLRGSGPLARVPRLSGQLVLLPELNRPVARLRDFGGGFVPASVTREIEFKRRQCGQSERQIASMIGISQGHYSNVIRGHDPISAVAVNRLRELLQGRSGPTSPPTRHNTTQEI